jgi:hypothetical protein
MKIPLLFPNGKMINNKVILFVFSFCLFTFLHAQTNDHVTLIIENKSLSQVFFEITQQTGYRFSYNPQMVDVDRKISINIENKSLDETLELLLCDTVSYKKTGKYIILSAIEETANNDFIDSEENVSLQNKTISDNGISRVSCHDSIIIIKEEEMKAFLTTMSLITSIATNLSAQEIPSTNSEQQQEWNIEDTTTEKKRVAQLSFIYPLGTSWIYSPEYTYHFSVNIIGGVTGKIKGIELASIFNINKYSVNGFQAAGIFNITGTSSDENSKNVQFAAGFNATKAGKSVQFAGGANIADTGSYQAAGGINIAEKSHAQMAGGVNITKEGALQIAGGVNIANKSHAQIAGGVNMTKEGALQIAAGVNIAAVSTTQIVGGVNMTKKGRFQMAGGVNIADISTCQIAGGVNITGKGRFQLGIVNIRDTADGVSLGIINIVKHGGVLEAGIEGAELVHSSITFRSGVQKLYTVLSIIGYNYSDKFASTGAGLGTSFLWKNRIGLNLELIHYQFYKDYPRFYNTYNGLIQFRPVFNIRIANHFKLFLGPTANLLIQPQNETAIKPPYSIAAWNKNNTDFNFWVGITGGLKF